MNTPTTLTTQTIAAIHTPARWRTKVILLVAKLASRRASTAHSPPAAAHHSRAARDIIVQARLAEDRRLTGL
jgi:hypothetical protein